MALSCRINCSHRCVARNQGRQTTPNDTNYRPVALNQSCTAHLASANKDPIPGTLAGMLLRNGDCVLCSNSPNWLYHSMSVGVIVAYVKNTRLLSLYIVCVSHRREFFRGGYWIHNDMWHMPKWLQCLCLRLLDNITTNCGITELRNLKFCDSCYFMSKLTHCSIK